MKLLNFNQYIKHYKKTTLAVSVFFALFGLLSFTRANSLEFPSAVDMYSGSYSTLYFSYGKNNFDGVILWKWAQSIPNTTITVDATTLVCHAQAQWFYYSQSRWTRLRPLDQASLDELKATDSSYDNLDFTWWLFMDCGANPRDVYGTITHTLEGKDYYLVAWTDYDFDNNNYLLTFSNSLLFDNIGWYFWDSYGWIAGVSWTWIESINTSFLDNVVIPNTTDTWVIIDSFINRWYTQWTWWLVTVASDALVGNSLLNLANAASGILCPQVPIVLQSLWNLGWNIWEVELPSCLYFKQTNWSWFTGEINPITFKNNTTAFELINLNIKTVIDVWWDTGVFLKDTNLDNTNATFRIPAPDTIVWNTIKVHYSQNWNNWSYLTSAIVIDIAWNNYVEFQADHFTYFALWSETGSFVINNDVATTTISWVTLNMSVSWAVQMKFGNTTDERDAAIWENYATTKSRYLTWWYGTKTVYAMFHDGNGQTWYVSDSISYVSAIPENLTCIAWPYAITGITMTWLENQTYTWRVRAIDNAWNSTTTSEWDFMYDNIAPTINLESPASWSVIGDGNIDFSRSGNDIFNGTWSGISGYRYEIATWTNFAVIPYSWSTTNTGVSRTIANGTYYRRVIASDKAWNQATSTYRNFMVYFDNIAPVVENIAPADTASFITNTWTMALVWSGSDNIWVSWYLYEVSTTSNFAVILYSWTTTDTWTTIAWLTDNTYYRHVKAWDNMSNYSDFTSGRSFDITVDSTPPVTTDDSDSNWYNTDKFITLSAADTWVWLANTNFCVDANGTCTPSQTWTSVFVSCADNSICIQYVRYSSIDNIWNIETTKTSNPIKINKVPPMVVQIAPPNQSLFNLWSVTLVWSGNESLATWFIYEVSFSPLFSWTYRSWTVYWTSAYITWLNDSKYYRRVKPVWQ